MGFYSNVQVVCGKRAAETIRKAIDREEHLRGCMKEIGSNERCVVFGAEWVKWYPCSAHVEAFETALDELDATSDKDCAYRMIIINEDNSTEERNNDAGINEFCDFYAICEFNNPYLYR